ncbi:MAG: helix-turn-helix domain-containing protein [Candidatus Hydrogenedentes bacterium]|nr:helix-turn-helix domain-containing protein [Candidatus Hydrogenedentota bacterium]
MKGMDIIAIRDGLGMSQRALGKALGVSKNTVYRWESGKSRIGKDHERKLMGLAGTKAQEGILAQEKEDLEIYEITPEKVRRVFASIAFNEKAKAKDRVAAARELAKIMGMYNPKQDKRPIYFNLNLGGTDPKAQAKAR